jgi:SAM-dependent methyltransferase
MFVSKLEALAGEYRRNGPFGPIRLLGRAARVKLDMASLELLRLIFGFERWHARSPDSARPYRRQLAAMVNRLKPGCVVEVGCGLGGIIARIKAERRYGFDRDPAAIRAARFLNSSAIEFTVGGFDDVSTDHIDVLIAVNWMHGFPPEQLEQWIAPLLPRVRYLLVDAIVAGTPGNYAYCHDFAFLKDQAREMLVEGAAGESHRRLILWEVSH